MSDPLPFFTGGAWRRGGGGVFESINPADGSVAAIVAQADASDVDEAVAAASRAVEDRGWRDLPSVERARLLQRLADAMEDDADALARAQMTDNGKTIGECRSQVQSAVATVRYYAAVCETTEAELTPPRGPYLSLSTYEPVGVVALITPWNSPLTLEAQKFAPALAAGNAVVLKPSEITPQVALRYARLVQQVGFPPGIFNVLTGLGPVGEALVGHRGVDLVSFTGGTTTGRRVAAAAAARLIPDTTRARRQVTQCGLR